MPRRRCDVQISCPSVHSDDILSAFWTVMIACAASSSVMTNPGVFLYRRFCSQGRLNSVAGLSNNEDTFVWMIVAHLVEIVRWEGEIATICNRWAMLLAGAVVYSIHFRSRGKVSIVDRDICHRR